MKKVVLLTVAGLAPVFFSLSAQAKDGNSYVGLSVAASSFGDVDTRATFAGGTSNDLSADIDNGLGAMVRVGHDFGTLRAEVELGWRQLDVGGIKSGSTKHTNVSGDGDAYTLMVNGAYDFEVDSAVTPYVMAGVGVLRVDGSGSGNDTDGEAYTFSGSANTAAAQAGVGLSYSISPEVDLVGGYSFLAAPTDKLGKDQYLTIHTATVGINYGF